MFKRVILAGLFTVSSVVTAAAETYKIDPGHSHVGFSVTHLAVSRVKGNFSEFAGTLDYEATDPSKSAVDVTIQTASINTQQEGRDKHLKSPDFFAVDSFPTMTFKSTKVTPKTDKTFDVTGDLTLHGVTKPVTLAVEMVGALDDPNMGKRVGFAATGKINRQDFGVSWSKALDGGGLVVGNDVAISLEVEAAVPREQPKN